VAGQASFLSVLEAQRSFLESRSRVVEAAVKSAITVAAIERTLCLPFKDLLAKAMEASEPSTQPSQDKIDEEIEP
ncbi:MAG: hypothetical protein ACYTA5_26025, partial [Planctomycetota bacterium]